MASTYFFNGELYTSPAVMSAVNDAAMASTNPTVGNIVAIIGAADGGQPGVALSFGDPETAQATLLSGELCQAVVKAFAPSSDTNSPSKVVAIRVGQATQASLMLKDSGANSVVQLLSTGYGLESNKCSIQISAGSVSGVLATISDGTKTYSEDNISRNAFSVEYGGNAISASMSITNSSVTLSAPTGTTVATLALSNFSTVGALVAAINATPGFTATIDDGQAGYSIALNGLDTVTSQDVKTAEYTATANLQAFVDWVNLIGNAGGAMTAVRQPSAGAAPAVLATTLLAGGTAPQPQVADWTAAFTALQTVDVQWLAVLSSSSAIVAAADAHVQYMSTVGQKERRAWCGGALGLTAELAEALPLLVNSDRTSMAWPGHYNYDVNSGDLVLWAPYMTAALIAAGFAGLNPGETMTNKTLAIQGLETQVRDPLDTDALIDAGVTPVELDVDDGYIVTRAISTWLQNNNYNRVEVSCGAAVDYTMRNVRTALKVLKGGGVSPRSLSRATTLTEDMLTSLAVAAPAGPGVLVGDANSPAFQNITAKGSGDVIAVSFQCSPVIPANFIPVTASIVPYSGTVTTAVSTG